MFDGINTGINNLHMLSNGKSRSISPENFSGGEGEGGRAKPNKLWPARNLSTGWKCSPFVEIKSKEVFTLGTSEGCGAIQSIWITGEIDRSLILRMYWDNQKTPAVEVPLTDFFLYGFAKSHAIKDNQWNKGPHYKVSSQLVCVNPNRGLNCFFIMPFKEGFKITLENRSNCVKGVYYQINYVLSDHQSEVGYFHAQYRNSKPVKDGIHTIVDGINGKGHYIGTVLYVGLNRNTNWWGEGEFKFYLDSDREYPTICNTGLEDYFGGAFNWDIEGQYVTYQTPYMGMPYVFKSDGLYNIQQRHCLYRWHVTDPIRFEENLKVTVQCLGWKMSDDGLNNQDFMIRQDDYISVAYWYQQNLDSNKVVDLPTHDYIIAD